MEIDNRLWHTDGLSRKRYEERQNAVPEVNMLEHRLPALMARMIELLQGVRFYNDRNVEEGAFYDLFFYQPLVVLGEIWLMDVARKEKEFKEAYRLGGQKCDVLRNELKKTLEAWNKRISYHRELLLTLELRSCAGASDEQNDREAVKREFYRLLETVRKLQKNHDLYLEEIQRYGKNDPALSILNVFLCHYGQIVKRFNDRWKDLPAYYFEKILGAAVSRPQPDRTWLVLTKGEEDRDIVVPPGTAFIAGKNEDSTPFCYRSEKELVVGGVEIRKVNSYFLERNEEKYPAKRLGFVTAVLKKTMDLPGMEPQILFGGPGSWYESVGLLIESPMLVLKEGSRKVDVFFRLTPDSVKVFTGLVEEIRGDGPLSEEEVIYKILNDAFYLEISIRDGWKKIPDYALVYERGETGFFHLTFRLDESFPATDGCSLEGHGRETSFPMLCVLMNREAWLYPYSWARKVKFDEMRLLVEVEGASSLKIYGVNGQMDTSIPVCPFGSQPERGAWFVFGNHEMARKPLIWVGLNCQWQQLPQHPEGFYGYYKGYNVGIDNRSFKVRMEWLAGKKWWPGGMLQESYLFQPSGGKDLLKDGALPESSCLGCFVREMPCVDVSEEQYNYGATRSGFIRVVLDEPEIGFGHSVYRQLFVDTMMQNSWSKKKRPLPVEPVSPLVSDWSLHYVAEETICFSGQDKTDTSLYHVNPLAAAVFPVNQQNVVGFANGPELAGNLLLGFQKALGADRLRFFVDMMPWQQETEEGNIAGEEGIWFLNNGKRWQQLAADSVLEDSTSYFVNSGIIEVLLPSPVTPEWLDGDGVFWLCAAFTIEMVRRPALRGIYMNAVEVVSDTDHLGEHPEIVAGLPIGAITQSEKNLPGIKEICQVMVGKGGRLQGDAAEVRLRVSDRIANRGRAVLPADYERLVLEHFPQVMKAKCLPGLVCDGEKGSRGMTLVVVPRAENGRCPLATTQLLADVKKLLQNMVGAFVRVEVINPTYEEMIVRCRVVLNRERSQSETLRRLEEKFDYQIAPWMREDMIPVFGYRFSLQSLRNVILEDAGVNGLKGLSILHVTKEGEKTYHLGEYGLQKKNNDLVGTSRPWCVAVPASRHLIEVSDNDEWNEVGLGDLEIGRTLVLG